MGFIPNAHCWGYSLTFILPVLCSTHGLSRLSLNYRFNLLPCLSVVSAVLVSENQITQVLLTEII